jgi:hypothetical protein
MPVSKKVVGWDTTKTLPLATFVKRMGLVEKGQLTSENLLKRNVHSQRQQLYLGDFPNRTEEVKEEQMYPRAFSEKVAIAEQRYMHLKKLVTKEVDLDHRHLLSKKFIRKAIESQQGPPNLKSSFLDLGQMDEEMKDEGFDALIRTKKLVQLVGVLLQDQQKRIQETFEEEENDFLD